jgi:CRP-like cAMP-binding protein
MSELAQIEAVIFLQSVDLFRFCKAEEILRIAAIARERSFDQDEKIYAAGDAADTLYCVVRGMVRLEAADGERQRVPPLHTFGVSEILSGRLRTSGATAEMETLVLAIDAEDFFDLLANNIEIVKALFRQLFHDGSGALPARSGAREVPR